LDLNSVIFPLEGETFCTGLEFVLALNLGCELEILGGVYIPFKNSKNLEENLKKETLQVEMCDIKEKEKDVVYIKDPKINQLEIQVENQVINQLNNDSSGASYFSSVQNENLNVNKNGNVNDYESENANEKIDVKNSSFYSTVKELMLERLKYPKGSYMNLLYKFLANAGIGQMARGLNQKVRYDSQSNSTKVLPSGDLVSPLYAG